MNRLRSVGMAKQLSLLVAVFLLVLQGCSTPGERANQGVPCVACAQNKVTNKPAPKAPAPAPRVYKPTSTDKQVCGRLIWPTGKISSSSILVEKCAPATVQVGMPFTFTLKVQNLTGLALKNVIVKDQLPANFKASKITPAAKNIGSQLVWQLGDLAPRASRDITITGVSSAPGRLENCLTVSHELEACMALNVIAPQLKLTKEAPADVLKCDPIPVKITVTNTGVGDARNVTIVDNLPDGLVTLDGKKKVNINVGILPAGKSQVYTINTKATKTGRFTNTATASAFGNLGAKASTTTVVRSPNLKITKTGPAMRFLGRPINYKITVTNTGNGEARNTIVEDVIPAGAKWVSASNGGKIVGGKIAWNLGTLKAKQSKTVSVKVTGTQLGTIVNTASANAYCANAVTATARTQVKGIPAILLECVDLQDPVEINGETTYVISVTNQGSLAGTNISFVLTLEDTMAYVGTTGPTKATIAGRTIRIAPLPSLAPQQKVSWRVRIKAVKSGDVRFQVRMNSDQISRPVEETESTNFYE